MTISKSPKPIIIRAALFVVAFVCLSQTLLADSGIYRSDPVAGTFSLGALRDLSVGIWYQQGDTTTVNFDLNGTRISHDREDFTSGFSQGTFHGNVWKWGTNIVHVSLVDQEGRILDRKTITYQIFNPSAQRPSADQISAASPVGTWKCTYTTGSDAKGNRLTGKATLQFRSDGTGTERTTIKGYADPKRLYGSAPGMGEWTAVTTSSFNWTSAEEGDQFSTVHTGMKVSGTDLYLIDRGQVGHKGLFSIKGATLQYSTDDQTTYTRVSE
jgi:hypothetical protein